MFFTWEMTFEANISQDSHHFVLDYENFSWLEIRIKQFA